MGSVTGAMTADSKVYKVRSVLMLCICWWVGVSVQWLRVWLAVIKGERGCEGCVCMAVRGQGYYTVLFVQKSTEGCNQTRLEFQLLCTMQNHLREINVVYKLYWACAPHSTWI